MREKSRYILFMANEDLPIKEFDEGLARFRARLLYMRRGLVVVRCPLSSFKALLREVEESWGGRIKSLRTSGSIKKLKEVARSISMEFSAVKRPSES